MADTPTLATGTRVRLASPGVSYPAALRSRIHLLTQIDRSQQSAAMQQGSDPHTARVRSVSESTGACMRPHSAGDCKRESSPRAAPQLGKVHPRMGRRGPSRVRPGQVADAMRVRAGVAPRVASGDRAASKGKPAGGCSSFKRRVEREERCAAPHARPPPSALTSMKLCHYGVPRD